MDSGRGRHGQKRGRESMWGRVALQSLTEIAVTHYYMHTRRHPHTHSHTHARMHACKECCGIPRTGVCVCGGGSSGVCVLGMGGGGV